MNTIVHIRRATADDIPIIQHLAYKIWPATYSSILSHEQLQYMLTLMYNTAALTKQMQTDYVFFIAQYNEIHCGFAAVHEETTAVFKLDKLYVLPEYQQNKIGSALLQKVVQYAQKHKAQALQLQVNRQNKKAIEFYKRKEFEILYEADFPIGNNFFMNDYVMSLSL